MTDFCAAASYLYKSQLKKAFIKRFGPTSHRQIENYIARAKKQTAQNFHAGKVILAEESHARIEAIARDSAAPRNIRLKAEALLIELHGLAQAKKVELDVKARTEETKRKIAHIFGIVQVPGDPVPIVNLNGNGNGNGHHAPEERNGHVDGETDHDAVEAMR